jgi:hypothetical protein
VARRSAELQEFALWLPDNASICNCIELYGCCNNERGKDHTKGMPKQHIPRFASRVRLYSLEQEVGPSRSSASPSMSHEGRSIGPDGARKGNEFPCALLPHMSIGFGTTTRRIAKSRAFCCGRDVPHRGDLTLGRIETGEKLCREPL